jgi:energy-coupling factor transporter transmembrane protein EcfT
VGIVNAAIWFGAGIFFTMGILPAIFSSDLHKLFGESAYPYFSGAVALVLFKRFFVLQYICGSVAVLHFLAEKLYLGRAFSRFGMTLVLIIFGLGLIGGLWLQPRMELLRATRYTSTSPELREKARHSFGLWHGVSLLTSFAIIGGLLVHLVRVARPAEPGRYGTFYQIP